MPGDVYNGMVVTVTKNSSFEHATTVHAVAFLPEPRLIALELSPSGAERGIRLGQHEEDAVDFTVKPKLEFVLHPRSETDGTAAGGHPSRSSPTACRRSCAPTARSTPGPCGGSRSRRLRTRAGIDKGALSGAVLASPRPVNTGPSRLVNPSDNMTWLELPISPSGDDSKLDELVALARDGSRTAFDALALRVRDRVRNGRRSSPRIRTTPGMSPPAGPVAVAPAGSGVRRAKPVHYVAVRSDEERGAVPACA